MRDDGFTLPLDQKARPTDAEDAAAWLATHYPDGVDEEGRGND